MTRPGLMTRPGFRVLSVLPACPHGWRGQAPHARPRGLSVPLGEMGTVAPMRSDPLMVVIELIMVIRLNYSGWQNEVSMNMTSAPRVKGEMQCEDYGSGVTPGG